MKFKKLLVLTSIIFLSGCGNNPAPINKNPESHSTTTMKNAVYEKDAPDPSIIRSPEGTFYVYTTSTGGNRFGQILKSEDLVNWEKVGPIFTNDNAPEWGKPQSNVWAPDIVYNKGTYYLYYSFGIMGGYCGIGVATSNSPVGPFVDHGMIVDENSYGADGSIECIDQAVTVIDDHFYMIYGSFSKIIMIELDNTGLKPKDYDSDGKVVPINDSFDGSAREGGYIIKMYDKWYFFGSSGTCCAGASSTYFVTVFKSDSYLGTYKDKMNRLPIMGGSGSPVIVPNAEGSKAAGTGHNCVIKDDDGIYWLVYHAFDKEHPNVGRKLCIDRLWFDENDFPYVKDFKSTLGEETQAPYVIPHNSNWMNQ